MTGPAACITSLPHNTLGVCMCERAADAATGKAPGSDLCGHAVLPTLP